MCSHPKPAYGFTLLELIVAISIAGILMAIAIPSFSDMMRNNRLTTYTNTFVTALNLARSEAIKRGTTVHVRKIGGTYWSSNGWMVFVDKNANDTFETGTDELLKTYDPLPSNFTLTGNNLTVANYIRYQSNGTINNVGSSGVSFAICDNSDGNNLPEPYTSRLIVINAIGRVRMGKDSNGDGIPEKNSTGTPLSSCTSP